MRCHMHVLYISNIWWCLKFNKIHYVFSSLYNIGCSWYKQQMALWPIDWIVYLNKPILMMLDPQPSDCWIKIRLNYPLLQTCFRIKKLYAHTLLLNDKKKITPTLSMKKTAGIFNITTKNTFEKNIAHLTYSNTIITFEYNHYLYYKIQSVNYACGHDEHRNDYCF